MKQASDLCVWPAEAPRIDLDEVRLLSPTEPGFLRLVRRELVATYEDGMRSQPFVYDEVTRHALDAVVICAHFVVDSSRYIYLRSALRPPLHFRFANAGRQDRSLAPSRRSAGESGSLWELPAGLIESDESNPGRIAESARCELEEELGFLAAEEAFRELGHGIVPCPAVLSERQFFVEIGVDPSFRGQPRLDGSILEHGGRVVAVKLADALGACQRGELSDGKTELGLRRLVERYGV